MGQCSCYRWIIEILVMVYGLVLVFGVLRLGVVGLEVVSLVFYFVFILKEIRERVVWKLISCLIIVLNFVLIRN